MRVIALLLLAGQPQPIVGGEPAPNDGAVVSLRVNGVSRCSGVLIGPRTVLTAAHCRSLFAGDAEVVVFVEPGQLTRQVVAGHPHPLWRERLPPHDLMLLELAEPVPGVTVVPLHSRTLSASDVGRALRVVGWGVSEPGEGNGTRRQVTVPLRQLLPYQLEAGTAGMQACLGDSGGPVLIGEGGVEAVAGIVSGGGPACDASSFHARVDIDTAWIAETSAAWDAVATCRADGVCLEACGGADADCPVQESGCSTSGVVMVTAALALVLLLLLRERR
jgi:uncharacterized protein (TIGR03382 family)